MKNTILLIICSVTLFSMNSCGNPVEIAHISIAQENGEKTGYIQCKSTSATNIKLCEVPGQDEIKEILKVSPLDDKDCTDNVGIFDPKKFWVLKECNAWIKFRIK